MAKFTKTEEEIISFIEAEYGFNDPFPVEVETDKNVPITHITKGSTDGDAKIGLWSGNPIEDKHAEEFLVSEEERSRIYEDILYDL